MRKNTSRAARCQAPATGRASVRARLPVTLSVANFQPNPCEQGCRRPRVWWSRAVVSSSASEPKTAESSAPDRRAVRRSGKGPIAGCASAAAEGPLRFERGYASRTGLRVPVTPAPSSRRPRSRSVTALSIMILAARPLSWRKGGNTCPVARLRTPLRSQPSQNQWTRDVFHARNPDTRMLAGPKRTAARAARPPRSLNSQLDGIAIQHAAVLLAIIVARVSGQSLRPLPSQHLHALGMTSSGSGVRGNRADRAEYYRPATGFVPIRPPGAVRQPGLWTTTAIC